MGYLKKHIVTITLTAVMLASFLLMIFSARTDSLVTDEKVHIPAGYLHVFKGDYRFNTEHPPLLNDLAGLFAKIAKPNLPSKPLESFTQGEDQWQYGDLFFYFSNNNVEKVLFWARLPFIFLTLGLIYVVFLWARALFGVKAGLIAATLTAFSPNILAHGRLATTDIGLTFSFVLTCYLLRKYILKANWQNAVLLGLSLGLVMLAKFSALAILPIIALGLFLVALYKKPNWRSFLFQIGLIFGIMAVLMWLVYAFSTRSTLLHLEPTYMMAATFHHKIISEPWLQWLLIPLDKFFQGVNILSDHNTGGHWSYLNGQVGSQGWWYYFPLVMLYKLTLPVMALFALSLVFFKKIKAQISGQRFIEEFLIIFPPILFLAISMVGRIDIGVRHILPILPFIFIFVSRLANARNFYLKSAIIVLVVTQVGIGILAYPNYLDYFNQIAGGAKGGIKHLSDSNLDWNQNMKRFGEYAQKNNISKVYELCWDEYSFNYYGVQTELLPNNPVNGVVAICAQQLVVPPEGFEFEWVTKYPPDDIVANGIYVWRFDLKPIK